MLLNVPDPEELNNTALRLHFDAWSGIIQIVHDFVELYEIEVSDIGQKHSFTEEWNEYIQYAQADLGAITVTIQQASELRLKSIIADTSPYLLLLNKSVPLKNAQTDIEFTNQRTLDAVDLPSAVQTLTKFPLSSQYIEQYGRLRQLRNQITHLGSHTNGLTPQESLDTLVQQYLSLWPDGRWLVRRVQFGSHSARNYFYDGKWASVVTDVMAELPYTIHFMSDSDFKKCVGTTKGAMNGFCPDCMMERATKLGLDGHPTLSQIGQNKARCAMCEKVYEILQQNICNNCGSNKSVYDNIENVSVSCYHCGDEIVDNEKS